MDITPYLIEQCLAHPSIQPQDIIKQCYQAAYGAEHLLTDLDRARNYLEQEFTATDIPFSDAGLCTVPLYEAISDQVCRINLAAWKNHSLPIQWLFSMFSASAKAWAEDSGRGEEAHIPKEQLLHYLDTADQLLRQKKLSVSFDYDAWIRFLKEYKNSGMCAVHHSETYRQAEKPAYRIVQTPFVRLLPILKKTSAFLSSTITERTDSTVSPADPVPPICIIAIDGRAASGKTTMARQLADILGAALIQMDDFFLPPALRTPQRLQTPGGNVHYERFCDEVLPLLRSREPFSYRCFDCGIMDYRGVQQVGSSPIRIVEGSYSLHPIFGDYADITVFSHVEPQEQMRRILHRNGPAMAERFRTQWIPMEEQYFQTYETFRNTSLFIAS